MKICLYQFFVYICDVKVIKHTKTQTMKQKRIITFMDVKIILAILATILLIGSVESIADAFANFMDNLINSKP